MAAATLCVISFPHYPFARSEEFVVAVGSFSFEEPLLAVSCASPTSVRTVAAPFFFLSLLGDFLRWAAEVPSGPVILRTESV